MPVKQLAPCQDRSIGGGSAWGSRHEIDIFADIAKILAKRMQKHSEVLKWAEFWQAGFYLCAAAEGQDVGKTKQDGNASSSEHGPACCSVSLDSLFEQMSGCVVAGQRPAGCEKAEQEQVADICDA